MKNKIILYGLFSFVHNMKGVPVEKLVIVSSSKSTLVGHHKLKYSDFPLIKGQPKEVAVFTRGGVYEGYFIKRVNVLECSTPPKRVERITG